MGNSYTYEEALIRQFAAAIHGNKREFYSNAPVLEFSRPMENVSLPRTAAWSLIEQYGQPTSVIVRIKAGGKELGASIHDNLKCSVVSLKDGVPVTDYADVAAKIEFLCEDLKRTLLLNLAKQHKETLDAVIKLKEQTHD